MPESSPPNPSPNPYVMVVGVVVMAVVLIIAVFYMLRGAPAASPSVSELEQSLEAVASSTGVTVPTTVNPVKEAASVSPYEKTNPFNDTTTYANPFE